MKRKIEATLDAWFESKYGILVYGTRQVGKTYILDKYAKEHFDNYVYINLFENKTAVKVLNESTDPKDFLFRLSVLTNAKLIPGKTVVFIDEIQELKDYDIVTTMKFLVSEGQYRYMLSGSMLGVELRDVNSWPVGYMIEKTLYPMDFEEFLWANGVNQETIDHVRNCFDKKTAVEDYLHDKMMDLFTKYLLVGGMPDAVKAYVETNDLNKVSLAHAAIYKINRRDVAKYASEAEKLFIKEIFDLIPAELNTQTKRFRLNDIEGKKKSDDTKSSFVWLKDAGAAIPCYTVKAPQTPLVATSDRTILKLFLYDTGILTYALMDSTIKTRLLSGDDGINFGSIYENVVAQSLSAHDFERLFYYNSKKYGEVDFLVEHQGKVLPLEIKSGKDYKRHSALNKLLSMDDYGIAEAYVFCNANYSKNGTCHYFPIYMIDFLKK